MMLLPFAFFGTTLLIEAQGISIPKLILLKIKLVIFIKITFHDCRLQDYLLMLMCSLTKSHRCSQKRNVPVCSLRTINEKRN